MRFSDNSGYPISNLTIGRVVLDCPFADDNFVMDEECPTAWVNEWGPQSFIIPIGMSTDLASVPRIVWSIQPPHRKIKRAAVFHDALYQYRPFINIPEGKGRITRGEADKLFHVACLQEGLSPDDAERVYLAVRVGGSSMWHAHDKEFV